MPSLPKFDAPAPPRLSVTAPAPGHADALPGSTPRLALPLHLSGAAAICVIAGHAAVAMLMTWSGWRPGPLTLLAVSAAVGMALSGGLLWVVGSWLGPSEATMLRRRVLSLRTMARHPEPPVDRPPLPWPVW